MLPPADTLSVDVGEYTLLVVVVVVLASVAFDTGA
jgi:hypothetical protein